MSWHVTDAEAKDLSNVMLFDMNRCYLFPLLFQMWNLRKSACDCACISSKMPLNNSNLWWLTGFEGT